MNPRILLLHVSARGAPTFVIGVSVITLLAWSGGTWLADRPSLDGPAARIPVVALAPLLAALLLGPTLAGADEDLERSTPLPWPLWRAGHVLLAALVITTALSLTGLHVPTTFGAYALARNTLGCIGLVAGAAVLLGARLAWLPAFLYVVAVYAAGPRPAANPAASWAWPIQPSSASPSWGTAITLFLLGATSYALCGPSTSTSGRQHS
ncbi:hypothetical protein ACIBTW_12495 [Micromonospora parva]|uniref:hypothetical protein n=1 Tax=Micromonospora parva TaxID=1464048 RepID=UPI00378CB4F5